MSAEPTLAERIARLESIEEITTLIHRRQWNVDGGNEGGALRTWDVEGELRDVPDSEPVGFPEPPARDLVNRAWTGSGLSDQFDGFRDVRTDDDRRRFARLRPIWMPQMVHFLTNVDVWLVGDATAAGRWYSWEAATVRVEGRPSAVWVAGRYLGEFERVDGSWSIAVLNYQELFSTPFDGPGWVSHPHVEFGPRQARGTTEGFDIAGGFG